MLCQSFSSARHVGDDIWWTCSSLDNLGDSAYALSNWLMKPYIDRGNLTPEERSFNIKHSTTRVVVENAFGRLKGRFRSIGKRLDLKVENACNVIAACCVLHNYCEMRNESSWWPMAQWYSHSCWSLCKLKLLMANFDCLWCSLKPPHFFWTFQNLDTISEQLKIQSLQDCHFTCEINILALKLC